MTPKDITKNLIILQNSSYPKNYLFDSSFFFHLLLETEVARRLIRRGGGVVVSVGRSMPHKHFAVKGIQDYYGIIAIIARAGTVRISTAATVQMLLARASKYINLQCLFLELVAIIRNPQGASPTHTWPFFFNTQRQFIEVLIYLYILANLQILHLIKNSLHSKYALRKCAVKWYIFFLVI